MPDIVLRGLALGVGLFLVVSTLFGAVRSFVLPRNENVLLSSWVFRSIRVLFRAVARLGRTYAQRDRVMALYAPVGLIMLPIVWLALLSISYTLIFWALGEGHLERCFRISNSSLLTLGSEEPSHNMWANMLSYSEATLGLLLLTLLISYLPTMYQAFSKRELTVARLELRAGTRASATELICWLERTNGLGENQQQWQAWEEWFIEIEETHTSLPILSFFRSPQPGRSWVSTAGVILDTAALITSSLNQPANPHLQICFKAGCVALNRVARFFHFEEDAAHSPDDPTTRASFARAHEQLRETGLDLHPEDEAWQQYHELRRRYARAIAHLARITMNPGSELDNDWLANKDSA
ncbi:hypothetical protein [Hymenobacter actinosclerus]|uniref:Uncharacterized protein n=1 Tax=Hymenobacter actinosclerus TaxID=82805 RepID=A0A1H9ZAJ2_9BACT|nr:hypothetical protein [Hymenobacter actinosclerus]SES78492.1 hypothetical protein SAMN04487998_0253 [Hymenobacter actinosclerus]